MTEHPRKWTRRVDALVLQATDPHSGRAQRNGAIQLLRRMIADYQRVKSDSDQAAEIRGGRPWLAALMVSNAPLIDYSAANRYLDTQKPQK